MDPTCTGEGWIPEPPPLSPNPSHLLHCAQAQTVDPQDINDLACYYSGNTQMYEFTSDDGYIESPNYPSSYPSSFYCQWYLNPDGMAANEV